MRFITAALALAAGSCVSAHATMFSVSVDGVDQGDGRNVYIRSPPNNNPVKDLASPDLVCNVNGGKAASSFVTAAAGSTLTFEWFHENRGDDIIDGTHKGPVITYIAPFTTGNGAQAIWTKIAEAGFASGKWAVDTLIANKGKTDFVLPANLAAGQYLIRQEIIALHEADAATNVNAARGAQFYPSCVQVEVTGSGTAVPSQNFDFNTGYTSADPGILFSLYASFASYPIPGPAVAALGGSAGGGGPAPVPVPTTTAAAAPTATTTPIVTAPVVQPPATTLVTSVRHTAAPTKASARPGRPYRAPLLQRAGSVVLPLS
ncbi:glycosyl hydrolase family 61-domain-containing protein [Lasiosphaeria hispida]|uniref:lytic cellulose monooxygenase (C4-dehydrogenating) n=1 Tax=Lasiosphaeria hispida TaxID=260671 RepID=A0AAJ0HAM8_9PEZI|nr:glycosyl hydrolase family 61-domain-containing protein [Lasiosphaeria hispida]